MSTLWRLLVTLAVILYGLPAQANPTFPTPTEFVTDDARLLSGSERDSLNSELRHLETETGWEVAVVTVPTLQGETVEDFAQQLFVTYGIGKKGTDNGVLLLVGRAERKLRIHTGYQAETVIPDITASRIIREVIAVKTKKDNWSGGIIDGAHEIMHLVRDEKAHPGAAKAALAAAGAGAAAATFLGLSYGWWIVIGLILLVLIIIVFARAGVFDGMDFSSSGDGGWGGGGDGGGSVFGGGDSGGGGASGDG